MKKNSTFYLTATLLSATFNNFTFQDL